MSESTRRTKIVATWGPAIASPERLRAVIRAGVDVFRLNFSHGTQAEFREAIPQIRAISASESREVALLQDIQGPRLRVGALHGKRPLQLEDGATVTITPDDTPGKGHTFPVPYAKLTQDLRPGHRILIADGTIRLRVEQVADHTVTATVVHGGPLSEHKGVNLPDSRVSAEPLTAKDFDDMAFGATMGVDYVALSFVRRRDDLLACRRAISRAGGTAPVVAKIEHPEAIANLESILTASDGVMVARGDLGVEVSPERVPVLQKQIIKRANELGIPVITATQMLESMVQNPLPTRAEASDVANAILDGTDAVMLSAETAMGRYPVAAVETMARIARQAEPLATRSTNNPTAEQAHAMARAARSLGEELQAQAIMVFTRSGHTAEVMSQQRPRLPIYAFTPNPAVCRRLSLWQGVHPLLGEVTEESEQTIAYGLRELASRGHVMRGDAVVVLGSSAPVRGGLTNLITVRTVLGT